MYDLKQDWTKLPSRVEMMRKRATRELDHPPSPDVQPKWDIPELVAVGAAVSGRIVRESDSGVTRNFALDFESFKREAILAIEAGACMVHLDPGGISAIMDSGLSVPEIYDRLYGSIVAETNRDWVPDVNILRGENFHENMYPVLAGMVETAPMAPFFPREWMESTAQVLADHGVKLFFSTHSTAEVDMADRFIVSKGLAPSPTCWIILIGYPYDDATQPAAAFLANPKAMMTELIQIVDRIRGDRPGRFHNGLRFRPGGALSGQHGYVARLACPRRDRGHGVQISSSRHLSRKQCRVHGTRGSYRECVGAQTRDTAGVSRHARHREKDPRLCAALFCRGIVVNGRFPAGQARYLDVVDRWTVWRTGDRPGQISVQVHSKFAYSVALLETICDVESRSPVP